jgi:hypothetical protein
MIFGLSSKIFEDRLLPIAFHMIPVVDHPMTDGSVDTIRFGMRVGFITNIKIEIFDASLGGEMTWFSGFGMSSSFCCCTFFCSYSCRKYTVDLGSITAEWI